MDIYWLKSRGFSGEVETVIVFSTHIKKERAMDLSLRGVFGSSFIIWLAAALAGIAYLFTFSGFTPQLRPGRINFGIDLVGGTYITLGVQTDKAIETELADKIQNLTKKMAFEKEAPISQVIEKKKAILYFNDQASALAAEAFIQAHDSALHAVTEGPVVKVSLREAQEQEIKQWAVKSNIDVLRTRLDSLGVGEITIVQQGEK